MDKFEDILDKVLGVIEYTAAIILTIQLIRLGFIFA